VTAAVAWAQAGCLRSVSPRSLTVPPEVIIVRTLTGSDNQQPLNGIMLPFQGGLLLFVFKTQGAALG